jgi:hypothetical protein
VICGNCGIPLERPDGGLVALPGGGPLGPDSRYGRNAIVTITGGSVTQVLVNGVSAGLGGVYTLAPGAVISITYTGTPRRHHR